MRALDLAISAAAAMDWNRRSPLVSDAPRFYAVVWAHSGSCLEAGIATIQPHLRLP